jgi:hypothetical protein
LTEIRPGPLASPPGHPDLDALADFDAGVLDPAEAARLQAHVAGCARCRAVLAGVRDVPQLLRALPPVRMPADVEARILAALDAERRARPPQAQRRAQPGPPATGPAGPAGPTGPVLSLDAARRRQRWPLALAAASLVLVAGGAAATIALQGRHASRTSSGSSAAEVLATRPSHRDAAALPAYDRQTVTRSPLLVSILNGEHGPLASADTSTDTERIRSCQVGVARQVPGAGTVPAGVQHIRFEGRPAYLLAYREAGRLVLVVVAERCSAADPAVLFSRPV